MEGVLKFNLDNKKDLKRHELCLKSEEMYECLKKIRLRMLDCSYLGKNFYEGEFSKYMEDYGLEELLK